MVIKMEQPALYGGKPVRAEKLFYGHQYLDEKDIEAVVEVLKSDYLTCGPKIGELEKKLCDLTGAKYACAVNSGTAALHVACQAIGLKPGDEVITTPITFAASANCVLYAGATPVFADINEETYNIDPESILGKISDKTKAVIAVDFTGQAVEIKRIREICDAHHLYFIEDAAHSIGTSYDGKMVGSLADITTFSFHPVKTVTSGEGGAVMTDREDLADLFYLYRSHGITREPKLLTKKSEGGWYYEQIALGMNYRMTDIQAGLLISQLDKLAYFKKRRAEIVKRYNEAFEEMDGVIVQKEIPESDTTRHLYILRLDYSKFGCDRLTFYNAMAAENICCNVHYIPVYYHPYYEKLGYRKGLCPRAEALYESMMSLPLYPSMTEEDAEDVVRAVQKLTDYFRRK